MVSCDAVRSICCVLSAYGFFSENDLKGLLVALVFYGSGTVCNRYLNNYFQIWSICRYILFFWLGFKIRQRGSDILKRVPIPIYITADVALFAIICIVPYQNIVWKLLRVGMTALLNILGAISSFVVLQYIANNTNWENKKLVNAFIKYSFPIYILHQQMSYLLAIKLNGLISPYIQVTINFLFTLVVSLVLSVLLYRFKPMRLLMGEK